jgi:predicted ATPase
VTNDNNNAKQKIPASASKQNNTSSEIYKIVLTGGPCGGKSTFMDHAERVATSWGYKVFRAREAAADLISSGIVPWEGSNYEFQKILFKMQSDRENLCEEVALRLGVPKALILCDRGLLDNKAYLPADDYASILSDLFGINEQAALLRYDGVIYLKTAAQGAIDFYIQDKVRTEEPLRAIELDHLVRDAWSAHPTIAEIDNSTNFVEKIERATAALRLMLGE